MNAIAKTKGDVFKIQLQKMRPNLAASLPSHISPEKFERVALTAVQINPQLLTADQHSLFLACQRAAADGLLPDGREGALVMFKDKVQWMPMVAGLMKLARNSGEISAINAHVVYEGEKFAVVLGDDERIEHERDMGAVDAAKPIAVYAVAKLKNGETVREVMTWKQIMKRRAVSRTRDGGPWSSWTEEMARKTAIRALAKRLPFDTDRDGDQRTQSAIERVDEDSTIEGVAETPENHVPAHASRLDLIEGKIAEAEVVQTAPTDDFPAVVTPRDHDDDSILPENPLADLREMMAACATNKALDACMQGETWRGMLKQLSVADDDTLRQEVSAKRREFRAAEKGT